MATTIEDLNALGVQALKAVRESLGIRSGAEFARHMAEMTGGSPAPSTYNRWEQGTQLAPAWALVAAAQLAKRPLDEVLGVISGPLQPSLRDELAILMQTVIRLQQTVDSDGQLLAQVAKVVGIERQK